MPTERQVWSDTEAVVDTESRVFATFRARITASLELRTRGRQFAQALN